MAGLFFINLCLLFISHLSFQIAITFHSLEDKRVTAFMEQACSTGISGINNKHIS